MRRWVMIKHAMFHLVYWSRFWLVVGRITAPSYVIRQRSAGSGLVRSWTAVRTSISHSNVTNFIFQTRALQPVATCRQSPYLHKPAIMLTSFSLWRHSLLRWPYISTPSVTDESTDTLPLLICKLKDCVTVSSSSSSSCGLSGAGRCRSYERAPGLTILRSTIGGCHTNVDWCEIRFDGPEPVYSTLDF